MAGFSSLLRRLYLTAYNWIVFVGWVQVLYHVLKTLKESGHENVYNAAQKPLLFAQTAAVLENLSIFFCGNCLKFLLVFFLCGAGLHLHGVLDSPWFGLVRSPVSATLPQIGSRLYLTWGILWSFPEIIRYSFFGFKEAFGFAPSWLLWLRYSTFLLLYPSGISSEVGLIYIAMPFIKASEKYCIRMPNTWNFSFDYFYAAIVALGIYVPGMNSASFVALTCIGTCLHRERKLSPNQRESRVICTFCFQLFCWPNIGYICMYWFGFTSVS
ncbi:hypothetical protein Lal_00027335 [Lupinus albus]|nr:hypothetical protein Lal_00027335 [Lupinus albus]